MEAERSGALPSFFRVSPRPPENRNADKHLDEAPSSFSTQGFSTIAVEFYKTLNAEHD
jgi:hypothetical protein